MTDENTSVSNNNNSQAYKSFKFDDFQPEKEQWDQYLQSFELELEIHELMGENKALARRNLLLSKVGANVFKVI